MGCFVGFFPHESLSVQGAKYNNLISIAKMTVTTVQLAFTENKYVELETLTAPMDCSHVRGCANHTQDNKMLKSFIKRI